MNGSIDRREVVCIIRHYALKVLSLVLIALLECNEGGLGGEACDGGESGDAGGSLRHLLTDVG